MPNEPPGPSSLSPSLGATVDTTRKGRGRLALALQEILTATVRLRATRQVAADAESFRAHAKNVLSAAEQEGRVAGYTAADVSLAVFAAVAFLDESVLNSGQPIFAEWPRKPLQDELFGNHLAGEVFFENLWRLLERADSPETADVLEVFHLCLLLGYQGRYNVGARGGELHAFTQRTGDKIARIRGAIGELSPAWRPPEGELDPVRRDPWVRRLALLAGAAVVLTIVLFVVYRLGLDRGVGELRQIAAGLP